MRIEKSDRNQNLNFGIKMQLGQNLLKAKNEGKISKKVIGQLNQYEAHLNKLPPENQSIVLEVEHDSTLKVANFLMKSAKDEVVIGSPPLIERNEAASANSIEEFLTKDIPMEWLRVKNYLFAHRFEKIK